MELQIAPPGAARLGPAVDVKATDEGLLISLTDKLNFMMFAIGSAEPQPQLIQAMDAVAGILKQQPGLVVVRGHTDAHPYKSQTYDNWRLSSARAQMAYYMLTRAGLPEARFEKIEGYADKRLRDANSSVCGREPPHRNPAQGGQTVTGRRFACAFAATAIVAALGVAAASAQSISDLTSDLQNLQTRIAAGDKAAFASQAERINAIGAAIVAAKPEAWQSKHETDAVVIYLFSGGQPRDVVRLIESGAVPASEIPLIRGALAYVLGNEAEADKRLSAIDARGLPLRLAGPMAFAQSVIETSHDSAKAIELLDLARLLAPGTLVEEAALRREVMLEANQHKVERVARLARQYASRFGASVYAEAFLQNLAGALAQSGAIDSPENFSKFRGFFAALAPDARRGFLLGLARAAILNGQFEVASMAAAEALEGVPPNTADEARGKLYEAMARILTPDYDAALAELQSVALARLDRHDQELLAAARGVAAFLHEPPVSSAEPPPAADAAATANANPNDAAAQTIVLAEAALGRTASLAAVTPKGNL